MASVDLLVYCFFVMGVALAPGPLITVILAKSLGHDARGAFAFSVGVVVAEIGFVLLLGAGLGVWLESYPHVYGQLKYVTILYVFWVAYNIWGRSGKGHEGANADKKLYLISLAGIMACLISPHLFVYLAILPSVVDLVDIQPTAFTVVVLLTTLTLLVSFGSVIALACRFRDLLSTPERMAALNKSLAIIVASTGIWLVMRSGIENV